MLPTTRTTQVPVTPLALPFREPTLGEPLKPTRRTAVSKPVKPKPKAATLTKYINPITVNDAYAAHWAGVVKELKSFERPIVVKLAAKHAKMCQKLSTATQEQLIDYIENKFRVEDLITGWKAIGVSSPVNSIIQLNTGKCRLVVTLASGYVLHVIICKFNFKHGSWIMFTEVVLTNSDQEEVCSLLRINCGAPKSMMLKLTYSMIDIEAAFKKIKSTETTSNYLGMWLYRMHTLDKPVYWAQMGLSLKQGE